MTRPNQIRRHPELGVDDPSQVYAILDEGFVCHVAYIIEDRPVVIPTLYVRDGTAILLHGSPASGIVMAARRGSPLSIAVTHVDGVVVARSGFQSSINYRSVVIHGHGVVLDDLAHERGLDLMVEGLIPGRLSDVRRPTTKELRKTSVVSVPIDVLSAKVSDGPPEDEEFDMGTGVWAGVVPIEVAYGVPIPSPDLESDLITPDYLTSFRRS